MKMFDPTGKVAISGTSVEIAGRESEGNVTSSDVRN